MAGKVTASGGEVVTSTSNHQAVGVAVSVCLTPAAPSPLPVPYPTMAPPRSPQRKVLDAPMRTKINGQPILTLGGVISGCIGNEPGTLKEVVSLNTSGPCFPLAGTPRVIIEMGPVCITGVPIQMNKQGPGMSLSAPAPSGGTGPNAAGSGAGAAGSAPGAPSVVAPSPGGGAGGAGGASSSGSGEGGAQGAGGTGGQASTKPAKETASDRMLKDFDQETRDAASKSPSLKKQMEQLENDGWKVQQGTAGGGSFADSKARVITIDPNQRGAQATGTIAHEAGHALHREEPYVPPTGLSKQEYTEKNVNRHLRDEGNAQLNAAQVRDEVQKNGGPDTGIPGGNTSEYQQSYDDYKSGKTTRDQAVDQMANTMGKERTSTTGENYKDYYGKTYEDFYDQQGGSRK